MIKAVIFDFGGVILNMKPLLVQTKKIFQISDGHKLWETINTEAVPLCKGKITLLQCFRNVGKKLKKKVSYENLNDLWIRDYEKFTSVDKNMKKLIALLKKNYKLAIVSNTIKEHTKVNKRLGRFDKLFDAVILSHEVGLTKAGKEIFLLATKNLNVKPKECIFIDDTERFLRVAGSLGIKTVHFKSPAQLRKDLKSLGLIF